MSKDYVLPVGKVSHDILKKVIYKKLGAERKDVMLGPEIGGDSAIVYSMGDKYIYITSDPITASKELIGTLAVYISTNDLIAAGAFPKWILINALLNKNITLDELNKIFEDINTACKKIGVSIVGGHTEITPYLDRPILVSVAAGTSNNVINYTVKPGDLIVMTKSVGIEGAVILGYEFEELLLENGVPRSVVNGIKELIDSISVVPEAKIIFNEAFDYIKALHDPTEGGIYTALNELLTFLNVGAEIFEDKILIYPIIRKLTRYMNVNPYFLLSSGSLIFVIEKDYSDYIIKKLRTSGIDAEIIGEIKTPKFGRKLIKDGVVSELPIQVKDEIWKFF